ncbi:sarcosine oxidase subunit gamma [Pseudaminobacter arsenicus]|uniref:Sarcosine oxidase subunit gamma n=1 Tax=Borborobacter arsenicus TaxID=1851146 RepID=A0A432V5Y6_9HYPH|nr:sarcosine oxidase subunit gamma family protein [Pseudaminobacter arsenicus]RUM97577.1 sarcosine oxidase subunit gamma [Pseudaminobacter arsenicus]
MAEFVWHAVSPLQHSFTPGRMGETADAAGVRMAEIRNFNLVQIFARRGQWSAVAKAAKAHFGVEAPTRPQAVSGKAGVLLWSGPDQLSALTARRGDEIRPLDALRDRFAGIASLSDQSDGRCLLRISGARARDMLAKVSSVDLDAAVFPVGAAAATAIDHTAANLWREADAADGSPVFKLLVFSSFADSLWDTLVDAAAEYGIEVESPAGL